MPNRFPAKTMRVHSDAESIVRRLQTTDETLYDLADEYGCSPGTINNIYRAATTPEQRREAWRAKQSKLRLGVPTGRVPSHAFKPGVLRGRAARRYVPVGTIVIRQHGKRGKRYRWMKVSETVGAGGANWRPLATVLWEKREGRSVPPGMVVVHDDTNTLNDALENLICVSAVDRLRRKMSPAAIERWRTGAGKAARERAIRRREAEAIRQSMLVEAGPGACPELREHKASTDVPQSGASRAAKDVARERVAAFLSQLQEAA